MHETKSSFLKFLWFRLISKGLGIQASKCCVPCCILYFSLLSFFSVLLYFPLSYLKSLLFHRSGSNQSTVNFEGCILFRLSASGGAVRYERGETQRHGAPNQKLTWVNVPPRRKRHCCLNKTPVIVPANQSYWSDSITVIDANNSYCRNNGSCLLNNFGLLTLKITFCWRNKVISWCCTRTVHTNFTRNGQ